MSLISYFIIGITTIFTFFQAHWEGVVASCALIFTYIQVYYTRQHNLISVTPSLCTFSSTINENGLVSYKYILSNDGLGPAKIESFKVFFDGKIILTESVVGLYDEIIKILETEIEDIEKKYVSVFQKGAIIPHSSTTELLYLTVKSEKFDIEKYRIFMDRFDLVISYKSMYGRSFEMSTFRSDNNSTQRN